MDRKFPLSNWFKLFPKTRTVAFPTNFYVPVLGNVSVVHKQTSFSKMNTELVCNNLVISEFQKKMSESGPTHPMSVPSIYQDQSPLGAMSNQKPIV